MVKSGFNEKNDAARLCLYLESFQYWKTVSLFFGSLFECEKEKSFKNFKSFQVSNRISLNVNRFL